MAMQLNFQRQGAGFPLVILHGLFGSSDNWQLFARQWGETYDVLTVDLRNHGRSPHSDEINYEVMTGDLVELLDSQGLSRVHLLGHSLGGKAAMHFALHHPERMGKLIVADMAPRKYPPTQRPIFDALLALELGRFKERGEISEALRSTIPDAAVRQFLVKNVTRDAAGMFQWKMNLPALFRNYDGLNEPLGTERTFDGPALFIRGGKSEYITDADGDLITRLFPEAKIVTIAEAGHWVHAEAPGKFSEIARDFLK
jgi:pimeloyl-ACP methyl ester carboxylesterase